jgi:hypothetical protein
MRTPWTRVCQRRPFPFLASAGPLFVLSASLAGASAAQEPAAIAGRIRIEGLAVKFPAGAPGASRIERAEYESAFLSPSASSCLLFDQQSMRGRVFDRAGTLSASFQTDLPFAVAAVSDEGLVALAAPVTFPERRTQVLALLDRKGTELWRIREGYVLREIEMQFSPRGDLVAVLVPARVGDRAVLRALIFGREGERFRRDFAGDVQAAAIAFSPRQDAIAFGARPESGNGGEVLLWHAKAEPTSIRLADLGQPLDRGGLAFSSNGAGLAVNGLARVQLYDVATGQPRWSRAFAPFGEKGLDTAVAIAAAGERIVAAHRIAAPEGQVRYAVHVLDLEGAPLLKQVLPTPQPRLADVGRFWDVADDGKSLVVQTAPASSAIDIP